MGHDQGKGQSRGVWWWEYVIICLIKKLKEVKSSSGKCKKPHNCMLSHSWGTWTYPQAIFDWKANMGCHSQTRGFLGGIKDSYSGKDCGNREKFLMNTMTFFL